MSSPPREGLGLYVHLPFCPSLCPYCDFWVRPYHPGGADLLLKNIYSHLRILAPSGGGRPLDTIFIGGGTPSMWPVGKVASLLRAIKDSFQVVPGAEISLEANPGTLSPKKLEAMVTAGINRLSIGAQSFSPNLLRTLGRRHGPEDIVRAVRWARRAGLNNLNLDLMYGLPGQLPSGALADIEAVLKLEPEHLSWYELTLSPHTSFAKNYTIGRPPLPSEAEMMNIEAAGLELLALSGLERYEVSNFAKPGFECRHNQSTWRGGEYLALGPSAHGHLAGKRWAFLADLQNYAKKIDRGEQPYAFLESLTRQQQALERIMLGLRTKEGVDLNALSQLLGQPPEIIWGEALERVRSYAWASLHEGRLTPTDKGLAMADAAAALFAEQVE